MQTTMLVPATLADLEWLLRRAAAGRLPEAMQGAPPVVTLPPLASYANRRERPVRAPLHAPLVR